MSDDSNILDFMEYGLDVDDTSRVGDDKVEALGKKLVNALKTYRFCYVKNHGVDEALIKKYFEVSRAFFEEPEELKKTYSIGQDYAFGWVGLKQEELNPKNKLEELHEAFNYRPHSGYEAWPPTENFETLTKKVFEVGKELALRFCDVLSMGLNQPKNFMRNAHILFGQSGSSSALRTVYYPPIRADDGATLKQTRIGEHVDTGTLSLTFQDDVGGLEVQGPSHTYMPIDPISGTMVVYTGAILQRWTADDLTGTSHRIPIPNDKHRKESGRQAIVLFLQPDDDYLVTCLDGSNKYEPITSRGYVNFRMKETMPILDPTSKFPIGK